MSENTGPNNNNTDTNRQRQASAEQTQAQSEFNELLFKSAAEQEKINELLKDRARILNETAEALQSEIDTQNSILNALTAQVQASGNLAANKEKAREENQRLSEELATYTGELTDAQNGELARLRLKIAANDKILSQQDDFVDKLQTAAGSSEDLNNLLKININENETLKDILEGDRSQQEKLDALRKAVAINKDFLQLQQKVRGVSSKVANTIGLSSKFSDTFLGKAVDLNERFKQMQSALGDKAGIGNLIKEIGFESFNVKNIFGSIVQFAAESALEISNLSRNLGAATGFGDVFNNQIASIAQSANMSGIGFQEAANALGSMANNLSSFDAQAGQTNKEVGTTVALLGKIGVQAETSTKNIDHLQRSMGLSTSAAADMSAQIALMGRNIGISTSKMMSNFEALKTKIAEFGNLGMRVFKEMNALVKATGLEIGTLTAAADKFNTFEGAAESVGKMNSVLGTQLSTLEMLSATDSQRILMIKQQVQMSVGNFDSLDRYTKMYIAQAMGVESVDKAQKLLNMSTAEYNKYTKGQQESADIQKELAEATEELVPMMQQLKLAGTQILMVFKPIITVFSGIINGISFLIGLITQFIPEVDAGGKVIEYLTGVVILAAIAFKVFGKSMLTALGPIGLIITGLTLLFGAFHLKGSPELWELPEHSAKGYENMANSMSVANEAALATSASMKQVHDSMHKAGGKSFSIEAMAKIDTEKIASGLNKVKSAMMELSTLKIDGFLAMSTDGAKSSIVMGSQGVIKSLSEGRLAIDVNMPEIALPPINVVVEVNGAGLEGLINARIEERGIRD